MKVSLQEVSKLGRKLSVEVPSEKVLETFDRIYKNIQQQVEIKGFRKGKAPIATIKNMYADRVRGDVVNELVQDYYSKALDEQSLDPINFPNIEVSSIKEGEAFKFTAEFEVRPEVELKTYEGLEVQSEKLVIEDSYVDKMVDNLRTSRATRENVLEDRAATKGDVVVIDFEGFRNGTSVENTKGNDFELELGTGTFIPGFEEGLEGTKVGAEKTLDINFPTDYHASELAGTPITFKVKVKGLKKKVLPELNDEFAKSVGFDNVVAMRAALEEDYKSSETRRVNDDLKNRLLKALVEKNPVEVPKSMLEEQKQLLIKDVEGRLKQQGMGPAEFEDYVKKWDSDFNQSSQFMIQSSFLIHAIAKKENLNATSQDLDAKIEEYAKQTGIEPQKLKSFYNEGENKNRLMFKITEDKVIDFLKSKAKIKEVAAKDLKD